MAQRIIRIVPYGRMANQMFQLMVAERLRLAIKDAKVVGHSLPEWNLLSGPLPKEHSLSLSVRSNVMPIKQIVDFANSVDVLDIKITGVNLRYAFFGALLDTFRLLFRDPNEERRNQGGSADDIVISVRLGDVLTNAHPNYFPLPLSWYDDLVRITGLAPIFVGEFGEDYYSDALRRRFPRARFIGSADPMADFAFIRNSVHIVPSVGTFSWLASWLSETAKTIYLPVAGLINQGARPDVDLLPLDDGRYRFFETAMQRWNATPAQIDHIINRQHDFRLISAAELRTAYAPHIGSDGTAVRRIPGRDWPRTGGKKVSP